MSSLYYLVLDNDETHVYVSSNLDQATEIAERLSNKATFKLGEYVGIKFIDILDEDVDDIDEELYTFENKEEPVLMTLVGKPYKNEDQLDLFGY